MTVGCDLQSVAELRGRMGLLDNGAVFSPGERDYVRSKDDPWPTLGGLWAAKEACVKALAAAEPPRFTFPELAIDHLPNGRPVVAPAGGLKRWLDARALRLEISISHSGELAFAVAVLTGAPGPLRAEVVS